MLCRVDRIRRQAQSQPGLLLEEIPPDKNLIIGILTIICWYHWYLCWFSLVSLLVLFGIFVGINGNTKLIVCFQTDLHCRSSGKVLCEKFLVHLVHCLRLYWTLSSSSSLLSSSSSSYSFTAYVCIDHRYYHGKFN